MDVLIIEDELLLSNELKEMLERINPRITVLAQLQSVSQAIAWLEDFSCDLIFMDIYLNDGLSFSIFEQVEINTPIIFTTAYDEYAIQAFDVNSVSYLLKPIAEDLLQKSLSKFEKLKFNNNIKDLQGYLEEEKLKKYRERIMLSMGKMQKPVRVLDIAYFKADDRYLFAVTNDGQEYFCDGTLAKLEEELNPECFFRVNRSYLVNYNSVEEISAYAKGRVKVKLIPLTSNDDVVVSANKTKKFKQWLGK